MSFYSTKKYLINNVRLGLSGAMIIIALLLTSCDEASNIPLDERMQNAVEQRSDGKLKAAIIELKNALEQHPDSAEARYLLGQIYLEVGRGAAAEKEISRSADLGIPVSQTQVALAEAWLLQNKFDDVIDKFSQPTSDKRTLNVKTHIVLGKAYLGKRIYADAESHFSKALEKAENNIQALVGMARISVIKDIPADAEKYILQAENILPNDRELLMLKGNISWREGDYEKAEEFYQTLANNYPYHPLNQIYLAWLQVINKKYGPADEILSEFRSSIPENSFVNYVSALLAVQQNQYDPAKIYAEKVLSKSSDYVRASFIAALATYALNEDEQSLSHINHFLSVFPEHQQARSLLAELQLRMNNDAGAYKTLKGLVKTAEDKTLFLNSLANIEIRNGDLQQARQYLEASLKANKDQTNNRAQLAGLKILTGDIESGLDDLRAGIDGASDSYKNKMTLARALIQTKKFDEALMTCMALQTDDPENINGAVCEGLVTYNQENFIRAKKVFKDILVKEADNKISNRYLVAIYLRDDDLKNAREVQEQFLEHYPNDGAGLVRMYILKIRSDDKDGAVATLEKAVKKNPTMHYPSLQLARHYMEQGKTQQALDLARKISPLFPSDPGLMEVTGKAQMILKKFAAAAITFAKLENIQKNDTKALWLLASAHEKARNYTDLETIARRIIKISPNDFTANKQLAMVAASQGDWVKADRILSAIDSDVTKDPEFLALKGRVKIFRRDYGQAVKSLAQSYALKKDNGILMQLSKAHQLAGNTPKALSLMEDWLKDNPDDLITTAYTGDVYLENSFYQKAIAKYNIILAKYPDQASILNNIAWAYHKNGENDQALSHIQNARKSNPTSSDLLDTEGAILLALDQTTNAIRQYRKAVDNSPSGGHIYRFHLAQALVKTDSTEEAIRLLRDIKNDGAYFTEQLEALTLLDSLVSKEKK